MTTIGYKTSCFLCALFSTIMFSQEVAINEVMASNVNTIFDEDGSPEDWIELYNFGNDPINLEGFGLTDDSSSPFKWIFPEIILPPDNYLLIWASNKNRRIPGQPLHTNFKISSGGEEITLTSPGNEQINQAPARALPSDVSIGRQPDGTGEWFYFYTATPGMPNTGQGTSELITPPSFSEDSGFFTSPFNLNLTHTNPNATIIYTLDGSEPDINNLNGTSFQYKNKYPIEIGSQPGPLLSETFISLQYSSPIPIENRSQQPNKLSNKNSRQHPLYEPPSPVKKATVLRARSYLDGVPSKIVSKTFFIWPEGNIYDLPILSLQTPEKNLFDYDLGTYTAGVDFDTWRANNPTNPQYYRPEWCNYFRKSSVWEYPVNVELFSENTSILNINAGYRIHGNNSRAFIIKSLRLYAKSEYDDTDIFQHDLFDSPIYDAPNPDNKRFKRILLRGNGEGGSIAYDVVFNRIMQPVYNGVSRIKPAIHFINGEYWGLTALRDRFDKYHYAYNFNLDKDNIAKVDCEGSNCEIDEGDEDDYFNFLAVRDFINHNDLSDESLYEEAKNRLDMGSFIDHMVLQIYSATNGYERKHWKAREIENDSYGDGRWRTTIQDFEPALNTSRDWLVHWGTITESPNESIFSNLLKNNNFRNQFINRFADMLNSCFLPENFASVVNYSFNEVEAYLQENFHRTPVENYYTATNKQKLLQWGESHPAEQRNSIKSFFNISETLDITLTVSDEKAGYLKMNTININSDTPGIAERPYPWTGIYFKDVPVTIKAHANPGYTFSHWSGDITATDEEITFIPAANMQIEAHFNIAPSVPDLIYFWYMDKQIPNDTPLEFLNATYSRNSLNASIQYESCLEGYPFDNTHPLWRKASLERRNAPTPLNYLEEGNNNLPYDDSSMKGLQIKQPFRDGARENAIKLVLPTTNLQQIEVSMAISSDGAANAMIFDYWNGTEWSTEGLPVTEMPTENEYSVAAVDLKNVPLAINNPNFLLRIRFDGENMNASDGKRVQFNNVAVHGEAYLSVPKFDGDIFVKVFPNPSNGEFNVRSNENISKVEVYSILGQKLKEQLVSKEDFKLNLNHLAEGIYFLKIETVTMKKKIVRIVKE